MRILLFLCAFSRFLLLLTNVFRFRIWIRTFCKNKRIKEKENNNVFKYFVVEGQQDWRVFYEDVEKKTNVLSKLSHFKHETQTRENTSYFSPKIWLLFTNNPIVNTTSFAGYIRGLLGFILVIFLEDFSSFLVRMT